MSTPLTILVLCTGNSARSILAEALINATANGRLRAVSAGSQPRGEVHPAALALLREKGLSTTGLRSKSWDEFAGSQAVAIDIVITVCDSAAKESCPIWPGHPLTAHWGIPDPAAIQGDDAATRAPFEVAYERLQRRIDALLALPFETLNQAELKTHLARIGQMRDD